MQSDGWCVRRRRWRRNQGDGGARLGSGWGCVPDAELVGFVIWTDEKRVDCGQRLAATAAALKLQKSASAWAAHNQPRQLSVRYARHAVPVDGDEHIVRFHLARNGGGTTRLDAADPKASGLAVPRPEGDSKASLSRVLRRRRLRRRDGVEGGLARETIRVVGRGGGVASEPGRGTPPHRDLHVLNAAVGNPSPAPQHDTRLRIQRSQTEFGKLVVRQALNGHTVHAQAPVTRGDPARRLRRAALFDSFHHPPPTPVRRQERHAQAILLAAAFAPCSASSAGVLGRVLASQHRHGSRVEGHLARRGSAVAEERRSRRLPLHRDHGCHRHGWATLHAKSDWARRQRRLSGARRKEEKARGDGADWPSDPSCECTGVEVFDGGAVNPQKPVSWSHPSRLRSTARCHPLHHQTSLSPSLRRGPLGPEYHPQSAFLSAAGACANGRRDDGWVSIRWHRRGDPVVADEREGDVAASRSRADHNDRTRTGWT
mmetsp:Transcript_73802/g.196422  ORF Transcript_73802/g.196422 Transcript_73802/m.196422 type:complete len:486 (+) Transcript_73802:1551-3008(+)